MGDSYHRLVYHLVFGTSGRVPTIDADLEPRLHAYMVGVVTGEGGQVIAIGGMADHVHLMVRLRSDQAPADIVRKVKANSSRWVHEEDRSRRSFRWQRGYGAFSVSRSQEATLVRYIQNQRDHHAARAFKDEFEGLLRVHDVEYDIRHVWGGDDEVGEST